MKVYKKGIIRNVKPKKGEALKNSKGYVDYDPKKVLEAKKGKAKPKKETK